ncbi:MAG: nuclear transport factor 2 family protein [Novosphingobium sp.]
MPTDSQNLALLVAKDEIRTLALLYSRAIDRKDIALLRDLYTEDATDSHGDSFDGNQKDYCDFIERAFPHMPYSGHHACNHLIAVDVEAGTGCGEVYAVAWHAIPDGQGGQLEDLMAVRYIDNYQRCDDGKWRFSKRVVTYDMKIRRPLAGPVIPMPDAPNDPSYNELAMRLFQRGARG